MEYREDLILWFPFHHHTMQFGKTQLYCLSITKVLTRKLRHAITVANDHRIEAVGHIRWIANTLAVK